MKRSLLLFLALSLCAAAQTSNVTGVSLSGDPDNPQIVNHSGKQVIAAMVISVMNNGKQAVRQRLFTSAPNQLPDGGSVEFGRYARNLTATTAKITAVIFADGEFRGEDSNDFQADMESRLQSMKSTWQMAKDGNWEGVKAKAAKGPSDDDDIVSVVTAKRLMQAHDKSGADSAVNSMSYFAFLPATTWKAGLLNWLHNASPLRFVAEWFYPSSAFAQSSFCCVTTHPYAYYNPPYYPSQWQYYCNTPIFGTGTAPCPGPGGATPYVGAAAICGSYPNDYNIGDQVQIGIDVYNPFIQNGVNIPQGNTRIVQKGQCTDNNIGTIEGWEYDKQCTGSSDWLPKEIYDQTQHVCGAIVSGY